MRKADPVDSVGRGQALVRRLPPSLHHVEDLALPIADQAVDPIPEPGRASGQVGPAPPGSPAAGQALESWTDSCTADSP